MITTSLMIMYAKCGQLEKTKGLFRETQERDLIATSLMTILEVFDIETLQHKLSVQTWSL